jgi:hypothetical protein
MATLTVEAGRQAGKQASRQATGRGKTADRPKTQPQRYCNCMICSIHVDVARCTCSVEATLEAIRE